MEASDESKWLSIEAEFDTEQLRALGIGLRRSRRVPLVSRYEAIAAIEALADRQSIEDMQKLTWPAIEWSFGQFRIIASLIAARIATSANAFACSTVVATSGLPQYSSANRETTHARHEAAAMHRKDTCCNDVPHAAHFA